MRWTDGVRAVFFDAVGTLVTADPSPTRVYVEAAGRRGFTVSEEDVRRRLWGAFGDEEEADRAAGLRVDEAREQRRWRRIVTDSLPGLPDPGACFRELWEHFSRPEAWRPRPEAGAVLRELAERGLVLGVASNFDGRLCRIVGELPELVPVRGRCVISSLVGWRKPSAPFFEAVSATADCPPGNILFVGDDAHNDYAGARSAGLRAVLLDPTGTSSVPDRIQNLSDLL